MGWLKDIVKPGIFTREKRDIRANVWTKCPECGEMLYTKELKENLNVCSGCGHHLPWDLTSRIAHLMDDNPTRISIQPPKDDPLKFKDRKSYTDRLKEARKKTGEEDGCRVYLGSIDGEKSVVCAMDFAFMAGSMGTYTGEAIVTAARTALENKCGMVMVTTSGGARMQEGILSLMQMVRTSGALLDLKEAGLPYMVLLTDPTTGGVSASYAMQGDVHIAEPGALIGFAGQRVIEQTIGEKLPEGFQRAEYLLKHGMVDRITGRHDQPTEIAEFLRLFSA